MKKSVKDAEDSLKKELGFVDADAQPIPDIDYSQELIHSNRPVEICAAKIISSDEMMMAL